MKIIFLVAILLFLGGLGKSIMWVDVLGLLGMLLVLVLNMIKDKKIILPMWLRNYGIFLILFAVSNWWSGDMEGSLKSLLHFISAGTWGVVGYNFFKAKRKGMRIDGKFLQIMIGLGLVFGLINILSRVGILKQFLYTPHGLVGWYVHVKNHAHIGNFWALVLVGVFLLWINKRQWWHYLLFLLGGYFVWLSQSRSALLSMAVGVGYLFVKKKVNFRKYVWVFGVIALVFVLFGFKKQVLLNRQYWIQGVVGVVRKPMGVGVGNFGELSRDGKNHVFGLDGYTSNAHNLLLELVGGMGLIGLYFVWWFVKVIGDLVKKDNGKHMGMMAMFLALSVNFMTDSTYLVPTMMWLWFLMLGYLSKKFRVK